MRKRILFVLATVAAAVQAYADALDDLQRRLEQNPQVQEKVYLHTDNQCYFIGDTIWYKAYVTRADDHRFTDMSKVLYVELLSPDGLVAERQRVIVSDRGFTCGQFVLEDSLYSGYYELRAYTKWQLNFNVSERHYSRDDRLLFYNRQMAADYFRDWEGLYSRVLPIYSRPQEPGNYDGRYMFSRPKQQMVKPLGEELKVTFYPEGGHLVKGVPCRVAFEATDQLGEAQSVQGKLMDGTPLSTVYLGRGVFTFTPGSNEKARFTWHGKEYTFELPKADEKGVTLRLDGDRLSLGALPSSPGMLVGVAFLCRGKLEEFQKTTISSGKSAVRIPLGKMPTGVCEAVVFDADGQTIASRQFFVNHHDVGIPLKVTTDKMDYEAYEPIQVEVQSEPNTYFSISVHDGQTDEMTYDDGNMLTSLLLASDLRGFIASPAYYFEKEDEKHLQALDLLMMVQGWRRYALEGQKMRYQPEKGLVVEGGVYKILSSASILEPDEVEDMRRSSSMSAMLTKAAAEAAAQESVYDSQGNLTTMGDAEAEDTGMSEAEEIDWSGNVPDDLSMGKGGLKKEVLVEGELVDFQGTAVGSVQKTVNGGRFRFELPAYYGIANLFLTAYAEKDSLKKALGSRTDKHKLNERTFPDFYVKQDLFFPVFSQPYSWYQTHQPDITTLVVEDEAELKSKFDGDHVLQTVVVKGKVRGRRGQDFSKPAYVADAYDLYNEMTDRGLSWGVLEFRRFPWQLCYVVYGNMNRYRTYNVRALLDEYEIYTNYTPMIEERVNRVATDLYKDMQLKRIGNVRFYTDYEPRNADIVLDERENYDDITLNIETLPSGTTQPTWRDRRYIFPGFSRPVAFYSPDYSQRKPAGRADYRRTLYWNPNAKLDENGHFGVTVYNNGRETRVKVSTAGLTAGGKILVQE